MQRVIYYFYPKALRKAVVLASKKDPENTHTHTAQTYKDVVENMSISSRVNTDTLGQRPIQNVSSFYTEKKKTSKTRPCSKATRKANIYYLQPTINESFGNVNILPSTKRVLRKSIKLFKVITRVERLLRISNFQLRNLWEAIIHSSFWLLDLL